MFPYIFLKNISHWLVVSSPFLPLFFHHPEVVTCFKNLFLNFFIRFLSRFFRVLQWSKFRYIPRKLRGRGSLPPAWNMAIKNIFVQFLGCRCFFRWGPTAGGDHTADQRQSDCVRGLQWPTRNSHQKTPLVKKPRCYMNKGVMEFFLGAENDNWHV